MRECGAKDQYTPCSNKRTWREWDHGWPGWGKRARWHRWEDDSENYPWRRDQERCKKKRKACLFHDPRVGKWCRNNRLQGQTKGVGETISQYVVDD